MVDRFSARAFWTVGLGTGEIREETLAAPVGDQVLVETLWSGVSRGTESLVFQGRVPASEHQRMRAPHQSGEFPFPVKYGYQNVGKVVAGPAALVGKVVFCLYPHQTRFVAGADDVTPLPDGIPPARAVLAGNLETAINGVWDAGLRVGERIAIVGAGVVGCAVAYLASRIIGCQVELVDVLPARARIAAALGVAFALPEAARADADVVVHASGAPSGLATALRLAGAEATIVEMSWYGDRAVELPLGEAFHSRRLTLRSSQVGGLPPSMRARWTRRRRLELALSLCGDARLDALVDGEGAFEELPRILPRVSESPGPLCFRVRYPEEK